MPAVFTTVHTKMAQVYQPGILVVSANRIWDCRESEEGLLVAVSLKGLPGNGA
jgi:hypothetical protein